MREPFVLPSDVRRSIVEHATRDRPHECCGLLVGAGRTVLTARPMRNAAVNTISRFRLDDREHIELRRSLRTASPPCQIVGVYHSHPHGAARPSEQDRLEACYPEWLYVIVGFAGDRPRVRGFALERDAFRPVRLAILEAGRLDG